VRITSLTYCLKDARTMRNERAVKVRGERREAEEVLGERLGRLVVVVGGGGFGSSLQHTLGMVSLPLFG